MWSLIGAISLNALLINAQLLGGWSSADPNDQKVSEIAAFAQDEINARSNSMFVNKVSFVASVSTQVVAGINYRVSFLSSKTKCAKSDNLDMSLCQTSFGEAERCQADVYVDLQGNKHLTKFSCEPELLMSRRAGGISEEKDNVDDYMDVALRALAMSNSVMENLKVISARTQTVAGTNYFLKIKGTEFGVDKVCDLTIWSRPWLHTPDAFQVTNFNCGEKAKRQLGGIKEMSNLEDYQDITLRAISMSNAALDMQSVKVTRIRTQTVAGTKYYIDFEAQENGEDRKCEMEVWNQPWVQEGGFKVIKFECGDKKTARAFLGGFAGGISEVDLDQVNPKEYEDVALKAIAMSNLALDTSSLKLTRVRTQVVAGIRYYIDFNLGQDKTCSVDAVNQAWMPNGFKVLGFSCTDNTN